MTARYCNRVTSSTNINLSGLGSATPDLPDSITSQPDESAEINEQQEGLLANQSMEKQQVHLWSAYNSLVHTPDDQNDLPVIDKTFSLLIVNAAATEWPTLVTASDQLTKLNAVVCEENSTVVVTLDMDLYKRVVKQSIYIHSSRTSGCSVLEHTTQWSVNVGAWDEQLKVAVLITHGKKQICTVASLYHIF